jgi:hypothetical protein
VPAVARDIGEGTDSGIHRMSEPLDGAFAERRDADRRATACFLLESPRVTRLWDCRFLAMIAPGACATPMNTRCRYELNADLRRPHDERRHLAFHLPLAPSRNGELARHDHAMRERHFTEPAEFDRMMDTLRVIKRRIEAAS